MLTQAKLDKLTAEVRRILAAAEKHSSIDNKLVESYWTIGERIARTGALEDAAYGGAVLKQLATALDIHERNLQRAVAFHREYPELPAPGLSWAHFRLLVALSDAEERSYYEQLARDEALSRDRLKLAIDSDVFSSKRDAKRRVVLERPGEARYVFAATLLRIVDGDTLVLAIDLGFEVTKQQRVRLAAVNTFSAASAKGQAATLFVAGRLSKADRIVVHTKRADLHGRYLAHLFYSTRSLDFLETFHRGHYLNQQLLDERLAMRMK